MWFRVTESVYISTDELVGFFAPGVLAGDGPQTGEKARSHALMRDGTAVPMPLGTGALAGRFRRAGNNNQIATGE